MPVLLLPLAASAQAKWYGLGSYEFFRLDEVHEPINLYEPDYSLIEAAIFHATNLAREGYGLEHFEASKELWAAAQSHSKNMNRFNFFSHTNQRRSALKTPALRVKRHGGNFSAIAENIAETGVYHLFGDGEAYINENGELVDANGEPLPVKTYGELAQIVVGKWMDSKGHRENILGDYRYLGCGVSVIFNTEKGEIPKLLVTQNFGAR